MKKTSKTRRDFLARPKTQKENPASIAAQSNNALQKKILVVPPDGYQFPQNTNQQGQNSGETRVESNDVIQSGGTPYTCPHCSGKMTYAKNDKWMDSQCPHCQKPITLGLGRQWTKQIQDELPPKQSPEQGMGEGTNIFV